MADTNVLLSNYKNSDGAGVLIDPNGVLFGTSECTKKNYLNFVDLSGINLNDNTKSYNYFQKYTFPSKVKF